MIFRLTLRAFSCALLDPDPMLCRAEKLKEALVTGTDPRWCLAIQKRVLQNRFGPQESGKEWEYDLGALGAAAGEVLI